MSSNPKSTSNHLLISYAIRIGKAENKIKKKNAENKTIKE